VGHAGAEEALGHGLQHDPHADVDLAKRGEIPLPHDSGIGVGQEPGFLQDEPGNFAEVVEGAPMSHPTEKVAMLGEEGLGLVAQREERFLGPEALARAGEQKLGGRREVLARRHHVGQPLEDDPAQPAPVVVVLVDDEGDLGVLPDIPHARQVVGGTPLGLGVHCRVQHPPIEGVADGQHERLARRVGGGETPHPGPRDELAHLGGQRGHARLTERGRRERTSSAKRSMRASCPLRSGATRSKTKWVTPSAA